MTFGQIRDLANHVRTVPLEAVLRLSGAQPDRYDPRKWHTPQGVLSVTGAKFMNWNRGTGGGGAIDLVIHLHRLGFQEAVQWLGRHFPSSQAASLDPVLPKASVSLPPPDPAKLSHVRHYLVQERALPSALIDPLIQSATLYADSRANAVFLLIGNQNQPVGAELRGTTPRPWRGMAPGSRKDFGFFSIPNAPLAQIVLCESAIDAISCFAIHPQHRCISTAGARPNPLWLPALIAQAAHVYCAFDADPTGDAMAHAMISLHPTVLRLRPDSHDWNDALRARS